MTYKKQSGSMNSEVRKPLHLRQELPRWFDTQISDLERSTAMFGRLAENNGNAMAQILYGLALRFARCLFHI